MNKEENISRTEMKLTIQFTAKIFSTFAFSSKTRAKDC